MQLENKEYQLILNEIIELYKKEDTKGAIKRCLEALEIFDTKYEIRT